MNSVLLDLLALGAILSSIMVITAKNPVISVLFLIAVFVNVAGYLCLLGVAYLGLVYLIVYVGAIAILFLFVIMMLNLRLVELVDTGQEYTKNLPMGAFLGSLFFFELLSILPVSYHDGGSLHMSLSIFNWLNTTLLGTLTQMLLHQRLVSTLHSTLQFQTTQCQPLLKLRVLVMDYTHTLHYG